MTGDARLTHLSLFSGIGGLDLAAEMAGFVTVGQCEWADYPTKILERHWPDVPRWRDIRTLTKESFHERTGLSTVDIVSGGFPCQPFSVAGKQRGKADDRYLWPEMLRVIQEIRPAWVVGENVAGIIRLALDTVLSDLENAGYAAEAIVLPACAVDAPHRRDRVAIIAYAGGERLQRDARREHARESENLRPHVADADSTGLQGCQRTGTSGERERQEAYRSAGKPGGDRGELPTWPAEPGMGRVANGIPNRVDRIKCLGNAVVPQQFYPFFHAIYEIETKGTIT